MHLKIVHIMELLHCSTGTSDNILVSYICVSYTEILRDLDPMLAIP